MASTATTFSLITAYPTADGKVSGVWLQDCCRGLAEARERAVATSKANSNQPIAVVPSFVGAGSQGFGEWCHNVKPLFLVGDTARLAAAAADYAAAFPLMAKG